MQIFIVFFMNFNTIKNLPGWGGVKKSKSVNQTKFT